MSALIDTLTTAPHGSDDLDEQAALALGFLPVRADRLSQWWYHPRNPSSLCRVERFTTDLNATFAEAQRRGWRIMVDTDKAPNKPQAAIWDNRAKGWKTAVRAATPALAACAALIAAVEAG